MEKSARNIPPFPFHVLIAAAGSGTRAGGSLPKQYAGIGGKTILRRTLEVFLNCPGLQSLRVVIDPAHEALYKASVNGLDLLPAPSGGNTRKKSIYNGLLALSDIKNEEIILIHDAARPFVNTQDIHKLVRKLQDVPAATLAAPVSDTLYRPGDRAYVDRSGLYALQTPQGFHYGLIRQAHEAAAGDIYTDDTALVAALGKDVAIVEGSRENIKITTPDDLAFTRKMLEKQKMTIRTGTGFDVHAFDRAKAASSVRLCGIDVPHEFDLAGHSDADAGLHALTDALLGAMAAGDIGQHFPPSDPQWKDADSGLFIRKALEMLQGKGGHIINLDLTLICEAPKIGPHRPAMQERIAALCELMPHQVSVKATTTEGLGFTGRGEGIAAQAVATIELPDGDNA